MISKSLFFAFVCISLGKCESLTETAGKDILQYLNSNSEQIYLYKSIKSLDIINKEQDKYDVKTAIDVDCLQDADSPCLTKSFNCEGELQYMEKSGNFEIISLFCNPEIVENLKSEDEVIDTSTAENAEEEEYLVSIPSETEASQPESTPIPYDKGYCTGCFENVNVHAAGVQELLHTALRHLESERDKVQTVLDVLSVQRQIVSGVHYVIIVKIAPTTCPKNLVGSSEIPCAVEPNSPVEYCKIGYLQQSWISKSINIISNNCTNSQEFVPVREEETTNVIDDSKKTKSEDMSPERLREMEMQIIADAFDAFLPMAAATSIEENNEVPMTFSSMPAASSSEESGETSSSEEKQNRVKNVKRSLKQSDLDASKSDESSESKEEAVRRQKRKANDNGCDDDSSSSSSSSSDEDDDNGNNKNNNNCNGKSKKPESNNDNGNGKGDDSSSSSSSSSDDDDDNNNNNNNVHKKRGMYKRDVNLSLNSEKALVRNLAEFALTESGEDTEDGVTRIVLDVIVTRKTQLEGFAYDLKIHTALADCKLPKIDYSTANLLKYHIAKAYSNCFSRTRDDTLKTYYLQVHVKEDFTSPRLIKVNNSRAKRQIPGGISETGVNDPAIVDLAHQSVAFLDRNSGHDNKLKVVEITSASKQVVSGMLYRISVKISLSDCTKSDSKLSRDCNQLQGSRVEKCDVKIWDQPWLDQGRETTFECENRAQQKFRSRRDLSQFDDHHHREKRQLVGGSSQVDVTDPTIVELAHNSTVLLDANSEHANKYKVMKITSASKQVVAGMLYKLDVAISLSDCAKTDTKPARDCNQLKESKVENCRIKIWDRPWLPNGRETTFNCDNKGELKFTSRRRRSIGRIYGQDDFEVQLSAFRDFKEKYNKVYSSKKEQIRRFKIFRKNLAKMHEFNQNERGTAVYGITKFSDLTYEEFRKRHMGLRTDLVYENEINFPQAKIPDIELPDEFDWRDKGVVTEVKNQGSCGSCWAFSTTGNVEGQYAIKHDKMYSGGLMDNAYRAIEEIGGLELESDYPYDAENEKCHYNKTLFRAQLTGAVNISQNEDDMAKWLVANGPIAIAINANAMQFYVGGVSHPWKFLCSPNSLDHGVLIVGYGVHTYPTFKKTMPYWIVKNSWGKSWGEQGYYLVYRGDGTCGVNQTPSSAVVA
ncbi:Cathepsin propeptide inhibitor domain (I29) [Popillia japonica]|uniref:Cathepsin propeptide inhibitor domain (I29) n=1 Tax=Popillia japonica TaxID=7064 RepID=A0AAW1JIU1_POPJA